MNLQLPQQEEGGSQPSKLISGRYNILPPLYMYRPLQDEKEDGNEIKYRSKDSQLATLDSDSGIGTKSPEMDGGQDPNTHTMVTLSESKTQTKVPHSKEEYKCPPCARCKGYFHHPSRDVPERFRNNPHLLVSGIGPIIPGNPRYTDDQRPDTHTDKNEKWRIRIGSEQKCSNTPSTTKTLQDTGHLS